MRRNEHGRFELRHGFKTFQIRHDPFHGHFIKFLTGLLRGEGCHTACGVICKIIEFLGPILRVLRLKRVLQTHIKPYHGRKADHGLIKWGPQRLIDFRGAPGFALQIGELGFKIVPGEMLPVDFLIRIGVARQGEQSFEIRIVDANEGPGVGQLRIHQHGHEPFGGGDDFWTAPHAFPWLKIGRLIFAHLQQRVAAQ